MNTTVLLLSALTLYQYNIHTLCGFTIGLCVVINKQNCGIFYDNILPDVIDRNIFNVATLHVQCIYRSVCWAEIKEYCIALH